MTGDNGAFPGTQNCREHRVQVRGEVVQAVFRRRRNPAAAVSAMVVGDDPVIAGQVVDLLVPDLERAGDAVGEDDRIAVGGPEDFSVQPGAVGGMNDHRLAGRQNGATLLLGPRLGLW